MVALWGLCIFMTTPAFKRILHKLSGEALAAGQGFGVDNTAYTRLRRRLARYTASGCRSRWWWAEGISSAASPSRPSTWIACRPITWACCYRDQSLCAEDVLLFLKRGAGAKGIQDCLGLLFGSFRPPWGQSLLGYRLLGLAVGMTN